ncbi:MAG TPA: hypothetical protein DEF34_09175 [Desulfotomaculum sp.]|nr:MAG: hypothetical protein JL56_00465 [Desulfotomaculum sp. BICA1-6]HBX23782.1 hypothetical protein [Desulfotomaculum sp.]
MECLELLAGELEQALKTCRASGWSVEVEYTSPPKNELTGQFRVVRCICLAERKLLLTVAREVPGK